MKQKAGALGLGSLTDRLHGLNLYLVRRESVRVQFPTLPHIAAVVELKKQEPRGSRDVVSRCPPISQRQGISPQAAHLHARNLETKGYLLREMQVGETNRFHLTSLFAALERRWQKTRRTNAKTFKRAYLRNEGSIPFTRSIYNQALRIECSKAQ